MASKYNKGDIALFADYGDDAKADANFAPILEAGQRVRVETVSDDGIIVFAIDEEGNTLNDAEGNPVADTVFPEEMGEIEGAEGAATETAPAAEAPADEAPAAAEKPKRSAGKAAAAPKEKAPTKAEVKAQEKAEKEAAKQQAAADKEAAKQKAAADKEAAAKEKEEAKAKREADKKAREEAKAAKPDNDDPLMIRVEETKSVTEVLKGRSAIEAAKMLVNRNEQTEFTLGGVLHHIYVTGEFKTLGYDGKRGFSDYVEQALGVAYRKARYLISIYTTFAQVFRAKGITEDDLLKLGWSKAKELARIPVNQLVENYDSLIAMASDGETSRDELIKHISENYEVTQRKETVKAIDFRFRLVADAAEMAKDALDQAKKLAGDNADDNKAFEYIVGDWLSTAESNNTMTLQSLIDLAAAQFGVTLVQSDTATSEAGEEASEQA